MTASDTSTSELASAIDACRAALETVEMRQRIKELQSLGVGTSEAVILIEGVRSAPGGADHIVNLRPATAAEADRAATFERCLLLHTAVHNGPRIQRLSMSRAVLRCVADELRFLANPPLRDCANLLAPTAGFIAMAKVVTLRRFPAGQLHFEPSGIPLSWLPGLGPIRLTRLIAFLARSARARRPFFFSHVAWRRKNRLFLLEREQNRSYFRMAQCLALNPEVKGLLSASWQYAAETSRVSPHLSWISKPFLENGGFVMDIGPATEADGIFVGSPDRKRWYEEGKFRPTTAMVLWPRAAMLDWAAKHPELSDD